LVLRFQDQLVFLGPEAEGMFGLHWRVLPLREVEGMVS
jgi:hypothetical protein